MIQPKHETFIAQGSLAELRLNGKRVGTVLVRGTSDSWSWGDFEPEPAFAEFAPLFGIWSLLMHADDETRRLSRAAADELRQAEIAIDSLRVEVFWPRENRVMRAWQINLDGRLMESKHE